MEDWTQSAITAAGFSLCDILKSDSEKKCSVSETRCADTAPE